MWVLSQREGCWWKATTEKGIKSERHKDEAGWHFNDSSTPLCPSTLSILLVLQTRGSSLSQPLTSGSCLWSSFTSHDSLPFSKELWILSRVFLMRSAVSLADGFWYQHSFISFTKAERVWQKEKRKQMVKWMGIKSHAVIHPQWVWSVCLCKLWDV